MTALLRERGIDLDHNRFLILQGEVEQIAMMKPKAPSSHEEGLLEYLEDIIGSNMYVERIEEAHKAMEELNEQRNARHNAMKASNQQVEGLEGSKNEAVAYLGVEQQLHEKQSALYQKNHRQAKGYVAEVQEKSDSLSARLADERSKAKENEVQLSTLEKVYKKSKKEHEKGADHMEKSRKEFQVFEKEDIKLREELKHGKSQAKKVQAAADKDTKKLGEVGGEKLALDQDVPRLESEGAALAATISKAETELEAMYDGLKGQTEPLRKKIEATQRQRDPEAQALATLQSEEQLSQSERQV